MFTEEENICKVYVANNNYICYYLLYLDTETHSKMSTSQRQNMLIPNPIYDGPMYETIPQPNFDTLASVTQKSMTTTQISEKDGQTCSVSSGAHDMSSARYCNMDRTVQTPHHLSKSFTESHQKATDDTTNSENEQEQKVFSVNHSSTQDDDMQCHDTGKPDAIQNFMSLSAGRIVGDKGNIVEDTYIKMDPASTISHSLRGGWGESFLENELN